MKFISKSFQANPLDITLQNSLRAAYVDLFQTSSSRPYQSNNFLFTFGNDINETIPSGISYDSKLKR